MSPMVKSGFHHIWPCAKPLDGKVIVVTYEIRVFFEGAKKEVFSSIFKKTL
jgi:hypothetical protein